MNNNDDDLLKNADIQKIAEKGSKIYDRLRIKYEPRKNGKFLAIEVESEKEYLGKTSAEALAFAAMEGASNRVDVLISKGSPLAGIGLLSKFGYKAIVDCKFRTVKLEKSSS